MGCAGSDEDRPRQLKVATLNYSGILLSPYEFFQKWDDAEKNLSESMKQAFDKQLEKGAQLQNQKKKNTFQFKFGPFDREWQQARYSPIYRPDCGIKNSVYLMSGPQFRDQWDRIKNQGQTYGNLTKIYNSYKTGLQKKGEIALQMEDYLNYLKKFDFLIYRTLIENIQGIDLTTKDFQDPDKFQLESKNYKANRKNKFLKSFLNEKLKVDKTISAVKNLGIDLFFIQEASSYLIEAIQKLEDNYRIVKSSRPNSNDLQSSSVILIRESKVKFSKLRSLLEQNTRLTNNINWLHKPGTKPKQFDEKELKNLNFNSDTVVQCLYNLILICPHLSSKKQINQIQIKDMKKALANLKQSFPSCHIIAAGDLNCSKLQPSIDESAPVAEELDPKSSSNKKTKTYHFNVVPNSSVHVTANKVRTSIQAQPLKANQHNFETKDYIITDLEIKNAQIIKINGDVIRDCSNLEKMNPKSLMLLPSDEHPYDHYMVTATLALNEQLEHVTDPYYRFKYKPSDLTESELENIHEYERRAKQQMNK